MVYRWLRLQWPPRNATLSHLPQCLPYSGHHMRLAWPMRGKVGYGFLVALVATGEMVLAQGLGDEDRQASRDEEGDRGAGASVGRDHAPHVGRRHRVPVDQGSRSGLRAVQDQMR